MPLYGNDGGKQDKFILTTQDQLKCVVTLTGDSISQAVISILYSLNYFHFILSDLNLLLQDISFKRAPNMSQRTAINPESPWKLQQIQDAANHLQSAISHIDDVDSAYHFKYDTHTYTHRLTILN